jgi:hypothetical protein
MNDNLRLLTPPQAVIYTHDMEPITIVDMEPEHWRFLEKQKMIRFAVLEPLDFKNVWEPAKITNNLRDVTVYANKITRGDGTKYYMLTTGDDENALLMASSFLPGQQRALQEERKKEFARGFLKALSMIGEQ